jgi:superfamily II DNA or RNA helicase
LVDHPDQKGILCVYETGYGKTLTAAVTVRVLLMNDMVDRCLIITPASVKANMEKQLAFCYLKDGMDLWTQAGNKVLYIHTYEEMDTDKKTGMDILAHMRKAPTKADEEAGIEEDKNRWLLVVDEAHNLKGETEAKVTAINRMGQLLAAAATKVMLLTGTPMYNSVADIVPLLRLLGSDIHLPDDASDEEALKTVLEVVTKEKLVAFPTTDLSSFFPVMHAFTRYVELSDTQLAALRGLREEKKKTSFMTAQRQICLRLGDESPKVESLAARLGGPSVRFPVLVFVNFPGTPTTPPGETVSTLDFITKRLRHIKYPQYQDSKGNYKPVPASYLRVAGLTGETKKQDRQALVDRINNGQLDVLVLSSAGAEGLDFKGVMEVHVLDPDWAPGAEEQKFGRAARFKSHAHIRDKNLRYVICMTYLAVPPGVSGDEYLKHPDLLKFYNDDEKKTVTKKITVRNVDTGADEVLEVSDMKRKNKNVPHRYVDLHIHRQKEEKRKAIEDALVQLGELSIPEECKAIAAKAPKAVVSERTVEEEVIEALTESLTSASSGTPIPSAAVINDAAEELLEVLQLQDSASHRTGSARGSAPPRRESGGGDRAAEGDVAAAAAAAAAAIELAKQHAAAAAERAAAMVAEGSQGSSSATRQAKRDATAAALATALELAEKHAEAALAEAQRRPRSPKALDALAVAELAVKELKADVAHAKAQARTKSSSYFTFEGKRYLVADLVATTKTLPPGRVMTPEYAHRLAAKKAMLAARKSDTDKAEAALRAEERKLLAAGIKLAALESGSRESEEEDDEEDDDSMVDNSGELYIPPASLRGQVYDKAMRDLGLRDISVKDFNGLVRRLARRPPSKGFLEQAAQRLNPQAHHVKGVGTEDDFIALVTAVLTDRMGLRIRQKDQEQLKALHNMALQTETGKEDKAIREDAILQAEAKQKELQTEIEAVDNTLRDLYRKTTREDEQTGLQRAKLFAGIVSEFHRLHHLHEQVDPEYRKIGGKHPFLPDPPVFLDRPKAGPARVMEPKGRLQMEYEQMRARKARNPPRKGKAKRKSPPKSPA